MRYRLIDNKPRMKRVLIVSLAETPFLVAGALLISLGGPDMLLPGVGLIAATAVAGSLFMLRGLRPGQCVDCQRVLEPRLEGLYCANCDLCYTNDPAKVGKG